MVRIHPICSLIRLTPVGLLVLVHCSSGHWPTDKECMEQVMTYGFSVDSVDENPLSIVSHMLVHVSSQHLMSNLVSLTATLVEAASDRLRTTDDSDLNVIVEADDEVNATACGGARGASATAKRASKAPRDRENVFAAFGDTMRNFLIIVVGGVFGGLGGQIMYNDSTIAVKREQIAAQFGSKEGTSSSSSAAAAAATIGNVSNTASSSSAHHGTGLVSHMSSGLRSIRNTVLRWSANASVEVQEHVLKSTMMCGVSAGVCALAGFNAAYFHLPITTCCFVVPEMVSFLQLLVTNVTPPSNPHSPTAWWSVMPGQTVGHAAHIGGFVVGASIGVFWRYVRRNVRRHAPKAKGGSA